jgi:transposase-like protein
MEFDERFNNEESCREYLFTQRWPNGFCCPVCGHNHGWTNKRNLVECSNCHRQTSLTAGTIMQDTKKPLRMWFRAMWLVCTQKTGVSSIGLKRILGLKSAQTAWTWLHKLRMAMLRTGRENLCGKVQVDDAFIGGVEQKVKGRQSLKKARIVVAVEIKEVGYGLGRIRIQQIVDFSAKSLVSFITQNIEKGSIVETDGWEGYRPIEERGFQRVILIASSSPENPLPHVNRVIALLKRWLLGTHQGRVTRKHLQHYLDEFVFRYNRRKSQYVGLLFQRILKQSAETKPFTYRTIVGKGRAN